MLFQIQTEEHSRSSHHARAGYHSLARDLGPATQAFTDLRFLVDFGAMPAHHGGDVAKQKSPQVPGTLSVPKRCRHLIPEQSWVTAGGRYGSLTSHVRQLGCGQKDKETVGSDLSEVTAQHSGGCKFLPILKTVFIRI